MLVLGLAKVAIQTLTLLRYQDNGVQPIITFSFVLVIVVSCAVVAAGAFMHYSIRNVVRAELIDLL